MFCMSDVTGDTVRENVRYKYSSQKQYGKIYTNNKSGKLSTNYFLYILINIFACSLEKLSRARARENILTERGEE